MLYIYVQAPAEIKGGIWGGIPKILHVCPT